MESPDMEDTSWWDNVLEATTETDEVENTYGGETEAKYYWTKDRELSLLAREE